MLPARVSERRSGLTSRSGKRSLLDDDFFSKLAQEAEKEEEGSDVSDADPMALLESMKDTDDMDADLFGSKKKTNSTAAPTQAKSYGDRDPKIEQKTKSPEIVPPVRPQKRDELTFDDEEDDLMDALGFGESPPKKKGGTSAGQRESNTAQTRLDEILFPGKSALPECPPAQEKDLPEKNAPAKDPVAAEDDFMFGSYQPTLASSQEGRESRRQSVRFSMEDISSPSPERKQSSAATAPPTVARPSRSAADWLGLKQEDQEVKTEELLPVKDNPKPRPASPGYSAGSKPPSSGSSSGAKPSETPTNPPKTANPHQSSVASPAGPAQKGEDDWLAGALTRKKNRVAANPEEKQAGQPEALGFGEEVDVDSFLSKQNSPASRRKSDDTPASSKEPRISQLPQENLRRMATPPHHSDPVKEQRGKEDQPTPAMSSHLPQQTYMENISTAVQSQLTQPGLGGTQSSVETTALWTQRGDTQHRSRELASQAHLIQLETQMRSLQLERDQAQTLLKTVQRRHTQDMELLEAKHRASVKLLEDALAEKEARRQQESEELMERLATTTRQAEQERLEQQAQYQRRLAQIQQDRDGEVKRLQELQRKSILEVKRDHEEQVQRLKRLKDEEIDAVTSATSQTRSVSVVMEQMDHISRRLGDLSSRMESSQEHSAQELEQGERQRREQLRVLQEHLSQQERSMVEERSRLKEVIAKMEAQLAEQQRQLEKERWRATADQAKAESAQRALEEERRSLTQHITMEREELERAKSALLDEQQSVMQHCSEERRKLAAEWAQFHAQEKQRQEWAERESRRAQERDANREGSIITIAQEQADLRLRAGEARQREEALSREKEALQRQREEAEQERERLGVAAGRLKTRALELEGFSKLASEKYEEGERALQEARRVEAEHSARLGTIHTQMERLRQQEQSLHQEQMKITDHHREAGGLRQNFPVTTLPLSSAPLIPADFASGFGSITAPVPSSGSTEMQAKLALIRNTAQKDRDFLQDEQFFLETLKKAPYNSTLHTA
ncbi:fas-binding factor 1 homolog [Conger conger]|uniref:fas-binding factor 1 homolog n=1 Tax=Conger conger TaxID=82655 RepID=UPI002A5A102B|nr:fas-binding factor 1 homolog [Conger conger]